MGPMASPITSLTIVYSTVYSCADQGKHQCSASLAFVQGIHRWPVNSPHKGPVTRKIFPFDDVIMETGNISTTKAGCIFYCCLGVVNMSKGGLVISFAYTYNRNLIIDKVLMCRSSQWTTRIPINTWLVDVLTARSFTAYHGYSMRGISIDSTSLHETNQL